MSEHPTHGPPGFFDKPSTIRFIIIGLVVACVVSFAVPTVMDLTADPHHHGESHRYFDYESILGFHAIFGFAAYSFIVLTAKVLRLVLKRPEDYYDQ